jgi:hypothetical protein
MNISPLCTLTGASISKPENGVKQVSVEADTYAAMLGLLPKRTKVVPESANPLPKIVTIDPPFTGPTLGDS